MAAWWRQNPRFWSEPNKPLHHLPTGNQKGAGSLRRNKVTVPDHQDTSAKAQPTVTLCPPAVPVPQRQAAFHKTHRRFPKAFPTPEAARAFLFQINLGPSMDWAFISVGKNASSSVKHALFERDYGCPMTADVKPVADINPSAAVHLLAHHRVFTTALFQGLSAEDLTGPNGPAERICVVRDPFARAVSAFRYLCKSHHDRSEWFLQDRFQMNAVVQFDWDHHTDTVEGFHRFLDFIAWQIHTEGADKVDGHWQPQVDFIQPQVYQPTLVGRMEAMETFWTELSDRLGRGSPIQHPWENRQSAARDALTQDLSARRKVQEIYAEDYAAFGY